MPISNNLRPNSWDDFYGQTELIKTLQIILASAQKRGAILEHLLLSGQPGLGKTSLAYIIANFFKTKIHYCQGPFLENKSDLLMLFGNLKQGQIVFIDEIHAIHKSVIELLYSIMEDFVIDLSVGPEGEKRLVRIKVPHFTLIGATTLLEKIPLPLQGRFGFIAELTRYSEQEIFKILQHNSKKLGYEVPAPAILYLAKHARGIPRLANHLLRRVIDFGVVKNKALGLTLVKNALKRLSIYQFGLGLKHLNYLKLLAQNFPFKYVSIATISSLLNEKKVVIEQNIEADLLVNQLIIKNSQGRKITSFGKKFVRNLI